MSLTFILKKQSGRANLKKWFTKSFPNPGLNEKLEIVVNPKQVHSTYAAEIGTAFDYLVRFNLERINSKTFKTRSNWIAQIGLSKIIRTIDNTKSKSIKIGFYLDKDVNRKEFKKLLTSEFKAAQDNYLKFIEDGKYGTSLLRSSLILAKLDVIARTGIVDTNFDYIEKEKIEELKQLLNIVPWNKFITNEICLLNPTFGKGSMLVGGADADLILDNALIDIKTSRNLKILRNDLNQIIAYYLLSIIGETNLNIQNIGIYFARFGYFWQIPLSSYYETKTMADLAYEFVELIQNRELIRLDYSPSKGSFHQIEDYKIDEQDFKCPHCQSKKFVRSGKTTTKFRYKCKECEKCFTSTIETTARSESIKSLDSSAL